MVLRVQQPGKRREYRGHVRWAKDRQQTFITRAKNCSVRGPRKWKRGETNDGEHAMRRHKGVGEFVVLRSTVELAQVLISGGDESYRKVTVSSLLNTGKPKPTAQNATEARRDSDV
jgi:hypothetical protein